VRDGNGRLIHGTAGRRGGWSKGAGGLAPGDANANNHKANEIGGKPLKKNGGTVSFISDAG
jgi:hypothetical protein